MKRFLAIFICLIAFCTLTVTASAKEYTVEGIKFSANSQFTVHTSEDLLPDSNVEGFLFAAISSDQKHSIQALCTVTEFSKEIKTFSGLGSLEIKPIGDKIFPEGYETTEIGSTIFLKSTVTDENKTRSIYVTVNSGKLYTFTYFGHDASKMGEFMATVQLPSNSAEGSLSVYMIILISVCIVADIVFITFIIISFIKDRRRRKMESSDNIVSQYIKIKRRKY